MCSVDILLYWISNALWINYCTHRTVYGILLKKTVEKKSKYFLLFLALTHCDFKSSFFSEKVRFEIR